MISVRELSREPESFSSEMLGVETFVSELFPFALFRTKPKDHRERGKPLTGNDVFIKAVWSSGMVSKIFRVLIVVQAMVTIICFPVDGWACCT